MTHAAPAQLGDPLTPTDLDTLRLAAQGHTAEQIARELHVSYHTITTRLSDIYRKLGATDRTSAVVTAHQTGVLSLACPPRRVFVRRPHPQDRIARARLAEQLAAATARAEQAEADRDAFADRVDALTEVARSNRAAYKVVVRDLDQLRAQYGA